MASTADSLLARNWWALALRGVLAVIAGLIALFLPGVTVTAFVIIFAAYILADGVFAMIAGLRAAKRNERSWPLFLEGVADILAGVIAVVWPLITLIALIYLIGAWAVVTGALLVAAAFRPPGRREWLLALIGVLSVIWGFLVFIAPIAGALALAMWFGVYAVVFGILFLIAAFNLRRRDRQPMPHDAEVSRS